MSASPEPPDDTASTNSSEADSDVPMSEPTPVLITLRFDPFKGFPTEEREALQHKLEMGIMTRNDWNWAEKQAEHLAHARKARDRHQRQVRAFATSQPQQEINQANQRPRKRESAREKKERLFREIVEAQMTIDMLQNELKEEEEEGERHEAEENEEEDEDYVEEG